MTLLPLFQLVERLRGEGFTFDVVEGRPKVAPASKLTAEDRAFLADLREGLALYLSFPKNQQDLIRLSRWNPGLTLEGLARYRRAVDAFSTFSKPEQVLLLPHEPTCDELVELADLKVACGGEVVEVAGPGGALTVMRASG